MAHMERYRTDPVYRKTILEQRKNFALRHPERKKIQHLKAYGLTMDRFNAMLEDQNYACAICGAQKTENRKFFPVVDHCHKTKKVRGLLCSGCNLGLGKFKDDSRLLLRAIHYLSGSCGATSTMNSVASSAS
jgi:hypothetical protein